MFKAISHRPILPHLYRTRSKDVHNKESVTSSDSARAFFPGLESFLSAASRFARPSEQCPPLTHPMGNWGSALIALPEGSSPLTAPSKNFLVDCRPPAYRPRTPGKASGLQYSLAIILVRFDKVFPVCPSIDCWRLSRSRSPGFTPC